MIRNFRALPPPLSEKDGAPCRDQLRQLAAWYRAQAERAGSLWVWEARLQRAEDLEAQAAASVNSLPDHHAVTITSSGRNGLRATFSIAI